VDGRGAGGKRTSITDLIARFRNAADMLDTEDTAAPAAVGTPDADGREVGGEDAAGAWGVQAAHTDLAAEELASRRFEVESSEARHVLRERGRPQSGRQIAKFLYTVAL